MVAATPCLLSAFSRASRQRDFFTFVLPLCRSFFSLVPLLPFYPSRRLLVGCSAHLCPVTSWSRRSRLCFFPSPSAKSGLPPYRWPTRGSRVLGGPDWEGLTFWTFSSPCADGGSLGLVPPPSFLYEFLRPSLIVFKCCRRANGFLPTRRSH